MTFLYAAYAATWISRLLVTLVIAIALLAVLALVVAVTSRGIWRALGGVFLTMRDVVDATRRQHPLADEEAFEQVVMQALPADCECN